MKLSPRQLQELVFQLLGRDLQSRYLGSFSGFAWAVVYPASLLAVYAWVFGNLLGDGSNRPEGVSFAAFLALGLWPWLAFAESLNRATGAVVENAGLIGKIALPSWVLVIASASASFLIHLLGFAIALLLLAATGTALVPIGLLHVLWVMAALYVFLLGFSLLLAALNVFVRDLQHALGPVLTLLFFLTPIVYPKRTLPASMSWLAEYNPLAMAIHTIREALLFGAAPTLAAAMLLILTAALSISIGAWVYGRLNRHFEDFL
jgi:lipopolysaccharide transport system permease protein